MVPRHASRHSPRGATRGLTGTRGAYYTGTSGDDEIVTAVLGLNKVAPLQLSALRTGADTANGRTLLNGRPVGKQIFETLIHEIDKLPSETVLPLSFRDVGFLDISCADEIVCRLITRIKTGELGGKFVILQDVDETVLENLEAALKEKKLCCLLEDGSRPRIIGEISNELRETYELSVRKGIMTTNELRHQITDLKLNAASNRLVRLEEMGLLYKVGTERGGRIFTYQAVA